MGKKLVENVTLLMELIFLFRFPRREDYEEVQVVQLDETYKEKLVRLLDTIETSQSNIKEVVDKVGNKQHPDMSNR